MRMKPAAVASRALGEIAVIAGSQPLHGQAPQAVRSEPSHFGRAAGSVSRAASGPVRTTVVAFTRTTRTGRLCHCRGVRQTAGGLADRTLLLVISGHGGDGRSLRDEGL